MQTFLLKKNAVHARRDRARCARRPDRLGFNVLYAPQLPGEPPAPLPTDWVDGMETADYPRLILAADRQQFYDDYPQDIRPTTDDRPFFFHTTKLEDQFQVAFGRSMLFGNGLSALLTLMGISGALVVLFVLGPLALVGVGGRTRAGSRGCSISARSAPASC